MQFLWWLFALSLCLYGLTLNNLNRLIRSWTVYNHIDEVLRMAQAIKEEKLLG